MHKQNINEVSQLRIIGGKWRSRKLMFPTILGLRPTPNRIRETLFNWLVSDVEGANCLDLFAGSGALSFEALSRGANYCLLLDNNNAVIQYLNAAKKTFQCENAQIISAQFPYPCELIKERFDIVFVDPPFHQGLATQSVDWLVKCDCLAENALIYIESEAELKELLVPYQWQLFREKIAGNVRYRLFKKPGAGTHAGTGT